MPMTSPSTAPGNGPIVLHQRMACDLLVIGSGAGGLAAATTAAALGLNVIVAEKANVIGGTTAVSGGWLWIPDAPHARAAGKEEDPAAVRAYLHAVIGDRYHPTLIEAYLRDAPRMLAFFEKRTEVRFLPGSGVPDFHGTLPGAAEGWRSVVAAPYDGRRLGGLIARLREPIPETTLLGMGIASGLDMRMFLTALRSPRAFGHVTGRVLRHLRDLALHGRGMQLVNGNALAARLLRSAEDLGVTLLTGASARSLLRDGTRVVGAMLATADGAVAVTARRGVVLATGGFPHAEELLRELLPHVEAGTPHFSAAPETNTGDGLRLAETAGGQVSRTQAHAAAYAPVSLVPRTDGTIGRFPHLVERGKPGLIAVLANGARFTDEGGPYHDYVREMIAATPQGEQVRSWLICDHRFLRRYGLGAVKPSPLPYGRWLRNGYLKKGRTLTDLARVCGIDPGGLETTVAHYNRHAEDGRDPQFRRGETAYGRAQGDPDHRPNPAVAPIRNGPFYAVEIAPGSLGTFAGIVTDERARALDADGMPIPGLYAAGNDMNSIMGGSYPSGGITLGPAMTFGFLAAETAAAGIAAATNGRRKTHAS
ncbi:FAD-dependent oxidoreductase [Haematobacter missouriensis]|nr:FAD-dependent oxidoreductase [Haematobacter missouriensis]